jgi:hypothetical protein
MRALSKPPPLIREEYQSLVEHIRLKGRIDDVSLCGNGDMFDAPIYESDEPPPLDKNAPERVAALKQFESAQVARAEYLEWFNSPAQKLKRRQLVFKRAAEREAELAERARQQVEYEQLQGQRAAEQQRRDTEWEQAKVTQEQWDQHVRLQAIFNPQVWRRRPDPSMAATISPPSAPFIVRPPEKPEWSTPSLHEISIWWQSGRLLFLEPVWQPKETDWYRVSGDPVFTVRNAAGYIASVPYDAPEHEAALMPLLRACAWPT